jgi:HD-GYP domain-containing protein (c-di-GMP phosphodiesterase class II)
MENDIHLKDDERFSHRDRLDFLNDGASLHSKLAEAHTAVRSRFDFIARIALTLYDSETGVLKAYLHSGPQDDPLKHYQALLDNAPSLREILKRGRPRVINNMVTIQDQSHEHTRRLGRHGYAASYTLPMFNNGDFIGFLFFNSREADVFTEDILEQLDIYGHLIALMVTSEIATVHTLAAMVKATGHITHHRDPETGSHLDRMSRFSLLIANALSEKHHLDDDYIQHVFMFSPLHDIGKIGIPDHILLKPGKLSEEEMVVMKTHAEKGREMIDELLVSFGLENVAHVDILRNIASYHHEAVNGSGYPDNRRGEDIPLEARIVAVADVFDALTSRRSYKEAWSNEEAFATLQQLAGDKLDQDCVDALLVNQETVVEIQRRFKENTRG